MGTEFVERVTMEIVWPNIRWQVAAAGSFPVSFLAFYRFAAADLGAAALIEVLPRNL